MHIWQLLASSSKHALCFAETESRWVDKTLIELLAIPGVDINPQAGVDITQLG